MSILHKTARGVEMKEYDYENMVSHLELRGYENPDQLIEDYMEGRLIGNDPEVCNYLQRKINVYKKIKPRIINSPKKIKRSI